MTTKSDNKKNLLGIYAVKSPYHEQTHYLPFIILSYGESDNTYNVLTIEYKGLTSYQIDTHYSEKSIHELIASETIIKRANPDNFKENKEISELISQYSNAENQQI